MSMLPSRLNPLQRKKMKTQRKTNFVTLSGLLSMLNMNEIAEATAVLSIRRMSRPTCSRVKHASRDSTTLVGCVEDDRRPAAEADE